MGAPQPLRIIRDRYRLDALIGEGGMASVWRAWDLTLQRPIAVKLLFPRDSHTTEALVDRFLREARIAASVQHRNVIHIVDFGTTLEGQPFMVMELLEGETLAQRLRREKPLPVPHVVQIGHLTLRGLGAVHAAGIIHRDLKPENVYLKNEGGVVYPKILDFGISRSIEPAARSAMTTRDGVIVGTPEYMSPEQARGVKQIDYRTDLYSMGVVLYEALTGKLPYTSENVGDLIIKIVTGCAPPVHEVAPQVPRAVSDVISRAMARLPGDRFMDATEMQEALLAAYRPQEPSIATLPLMSDLPPISSSASAPVLLPRSPRPTSLSMPRTQAMRIPMLVPANQLDDQTAPAPAPASRPGLPATISGFPSGPPVAAPTSERRELPETIPSGPAPHTSAAEGNDLATISGFPSAPPVAAAIAPRITPNARNWSALLQRTAAAGRALMPRTGATLKLPTLTAPEPAPAEPPAHSPEPPPEPQPYAAERVGPAALPKQEPPDARPNEEITAPNTAGEALPMPELRVPHTPWRSLALVITGAALLISGIAMLSSSPRAVSPLKAPPPPATSVAPARLTQPPPTVTLQLAGVPSNASVTLDGAPASPTMELVRGVTPRSVAVLVPGKQPWHVSYVPNADQTLEVQLIDLPPSAAKPAAWNGKPAKHPGGKGKRPGALRVPDF